MTVLQWNICQYNMEIYAIDTVEYISVFQVNKFYYYSGIYASGTVDHMQ